MVDMYRRNQNREERTCKFCGAVGLKWSEIAPNKHRLVETNGAVHDCRQFHDNKRSGPPRETVDRGSALRRLNMWMQRWSKTLPADANDELEEIIDEMSRR